MNEVEILSHNDNYACAGQDVSEASSSLTSPESHSEDLSEKSSKISVERYEDEWATVNNVVNSGNFRNISIDGELRASRFRSIYWRLFLNILGRDVKKWVDEIVDHRKLYDRLVLELDASPWSSTNNCATDNPLSQENGSVWCRYFCDEELRAVIRQDVIRTFPGIDFFHGSHIQDMMVRILFLYARKNPTLCYRQGMHEVLAPILFVLHCDEQAFAHAQEMGSLDEDLQIIFDAQHLASDAFAIFTRVMANLESSYAVPKQNLTPIHQVEEQGKERDNEVIWRLEYIREKLLHRTDPELANHLLLLDIPLQLFGIRWLRLLFGREFPLQDLLVLWDVIFSTEDFFLVDYIVVAMLVAIRHLRRDYTSCLSCLMRYPVGVDVTFILQQAHHLLDPQKYPKPPQPPTCPPADDRAFNQRRLGNIPRIPSFRFRSSPNHPSTWLPKSHLPLVASEDKDSSNPVDGFALQEPERLRQEVEHLRAVLSLVRIKISQYHDALQDVVHASGNPIASQALEGLHELDFLMKDPYPPELAEVEPAYEAGEKLPTSPTPISIPEQSIKLPEPPPPPLTPPCLLLSHREELDVFKHTLGGDDPIDGAPMADPLRKLGNIPPTDDWRQFSKDLNKLGVSQ